MSNEQKQTIAEWINKKIQELQEKLIASMELEYEYAIESFVEELSNFVKMKKVIENQNTV